VFLSIDLTPFTPWLAAMGMILLEAEIRDLFI